MTAEAILSTQRNEKIARLRVICVKPPDFSNVEFGIQDKNRVVHQVAPDGDGNTQYDIEVRVKWDAKKKSPNFLGPWTHGPVDERFLYLSWRELDLVSDAFSRRMKIPLSPITWERIEEAEQTGSILEVTVPGTAEDGGLTCGSVSFLDDVWIVRRTLSYEPIQPTI